MPDTSPIHLPTMQEAFQSLAAHVRGILEGDLTSQAMYVARVVRDATMMTSASRMPCRMTRFLSIFPVLASCCLNLSLKMLIGEQDMVVERQISTETRTMVSEHFLERKRRSEDTPIISSRTVSAD